MFCVSHGTQTASTVNTWAPAEIFVGGGGCKAKYGPPINTKKALHMEKKVAKRPPPGLGSSTVLVLGTCT